MWIRNAYSELETYLLRKYEDARDARSYVDSMLQKMHSFCVKSGKIVAGDSLLSKWKRWMCHAVLAMSDVSDASMSTTIEWLVSADLNFDPKKVLAILEALEKKNRATKIFRFSKLQLSVLCTCPHEDSAAPPDPDAAVLIHLFGDATSLLRSRQRHYSFTETLQELGNEFQGDRVKFEDHCVAGCQLLSIAESIVSTSKRFQNHVFPQNHALSFGQVRTSVGYRTRRRTSTRWTVPICPTRSPCSRLN